MRSTGPLTILVSICLFAGCVFAQDPEVEGSAARNRCFFGELTNNEGNITEIECDFAAGNACETKIEAKEGENFIRVTRQCTQLLACENNASGNNPKCTPGENGVRQCFSCCQTDLCNGAVVPDEMD